VSFPSKEGISIMTHNHQAGTRGHAAPEGPCRDYDPNFKLHGCELGAGHDGPHRDILGNEWEEHLPGEPGRCEANWGEWHTFRCVHGTGHDGQHRDQHGNEWDEQPPGEPGRCDVDWGSGYRSQRCTLSTGHDGQHRDRSGNNWGEPETPSKAAERAAIIPDLGELASRIDVVLAHSWIDRGVFLRDTLHGLRQAVDALPSGPGRGQLAAVVARVGRVVADPRADREACLREARDALGPLAESTAADLRAAAARAAWVAGLRDLADFLEGHPDVPVPPAWHSQVIDEFPDGDTDEQRRAGVDRAAEAMRVPAAETRGGHYKASVHFGPVGYEVVAIPAGRRAGVSGAAA
jgi:hypothetical protein